MHKVRIFHPSRKLTGSIRLPYSKSESNRALILQALAHHSFDIQNLSEARDTQRLKELLADPSPTADVWDAGTSMRFLTAYYAAANQAKTICGTERMHKRPLKPLVEALNQLGFRVSYDGESGFPPVTVHPLPSPEHIGKQVCLEGHISSQFITALLLIAPFLPHGLLVQCSSPPVSVPYIDMTLAMLHHFGIKHSRQGQSIYVEKGSLGGNSFSVGADWSAASYWYAMAFLADEVDLILEGLHEHFRQGDRILADWMRVFGIATTFSPHGVRLSKTNTPHPRYMKMNFSDNPDLAQTFAVMLAAKNVTVAFSGLDSLRLKETDRIAALQAELAKCGCHLRFSDEFNFYQLRDRFTPPTLPIQTYKDHRMAMSFAPLGLLCPIVLEDPETVEKSYPQFWTDLQKAGFEVSFS